MPIPTSRSRRPTPTRSSPPTSAIGWGEAIQEQSNDVGAIVYHRNEKGQVTERTDARGVVSDFSYDDAGRVTAAVYPGETSSNATYTYDSTTSGNKGIGRLTGVTDPAGTVSYVYDLLGRVAQETRVIGTNSYVTAYEYDAAGNVVNMTYPSGRIVFFDRDDDGKTGVIRPGIVCLYQCPDGEIIRSPRPSVGCPAFHAKGYGISLPY
jgi:YD repeat-containing protein